MEAPGTMGFAFLMMASRPMEFPEVSWGAWLRTDTGPAGSSRTDLLKSTSLPTTVFGESIEVNPKPEQEIKCNSEVKYDSDRHYRDQVETVVAVQNCTWRNYKSQVYLEPRTRPLHYRITTIVYPKHAKSIYRTTLNYNAAGSRRWFVSTVQLESGEDTSPCIIYTEDL
ncbi:hypothetical protein CRUP_006194 [Coryphaenoides rupestris]|nr:hypothetical protein CRUP_006194 [Coryphaenoides rupestris]